MIDDLTPDPAERKPESFARRALHGIGWSTLGGIVFASGVFYARQMLPSGTAEQALTISRANAADIVRVNSDVHDVRNQVNALEVDKRLSRIEGQQGMIIEQLNRQSDRLDRLLGDRPTHGGVP